MNEKILKEFVRRNPNYSFRLGDYTIPSRLYSTRGNIINLEYNRKSITDQASEWSPKFRSKYDKFLNSIPELSRKYISYIQEMPIIIENRNYWNSLCNIYNVDNIKRDTNYFVLDYFFPYLGFAVEIDSNCHNKNYDIARDKYNKIVCGIDTLRFYQYGCDKYKTKSFDLELLNTICQRYAISKYYEFETFVNLDFTQTSIKLFNIENNNILGLFNFCENKLINTTINNNTLWIDYNEIKNNYIFINDKIFKSVQRLFFLFYNVKLKITNIPSNSYICNTTGE